MAGNCDSCGCQLSVLIPYEPGKEMSDFYYKEVVCKIVHGSHFSSKCLYNRNKPFGNGQTNVGEDADDWENQRQQCLENQRANGEHILSKYLQRHQIYGHSIVGDNFANFFEICLNSI